MIKILVLGAGKRQRVEGAEHHDRFQFDGIDHVFNLNYQWPLPRESYDHLISTHCVEHLENLVDFMDQSWYLLRPGGILEIETPNAGVNPDLTNCDPTHVKLYRPYTFHNYFTPYGIEQFGYTDKPWEILEIKTFQLEIPDDCIYVKLRPIK